jgi:hypothetical protein
MRKKTLVMVGIVFLLIMIGTSVAFFVLWGKVSDSKSNGAAFSENAKEKATVGRKEESLSSKDVRGQSRRCRRKTLSSGGNSP